MSVRAAAFVAMLALLAGTACAAPADEGLAVPALHVAGEDGQAVLETGNALLWSRCVEGMRWDGRRCVGEALLLTHAQAIAAAARRAKSEGLAWRLPRVPELRRLADRLAHLSAAEARRLFPAAPQDGYWSATANLQPGRNANPYNYGNVMRGRVDGSAAPGDAALFGWVVEMPGGTARGDVPKSTRLPVRLLRAAD